MRTYDDLQLGSVLTVYPICHGIAWWTHPLRDRCIVCRRKEFYAKGQLAVIPSPQPASSDEAPS